MVSLTTMLPPSSSGRPRIKFRAALQVVICGVSLLLTGCSSPQLQQQPSALPKPLVVNIPSTAKFQESIRFNDYTISRYFIEGQNSVLEISKAGVPVFALQETGIFPGSYGFGDNEKFPIGKNLTGDGKPNLVLRTYSGGANCCTDVHVFELGEQFRHVARFDARNAEGVSFEDLDKNGILTVSMADWHYIDVIAPMIASPAPRITFRYRDGCYQLAPDLMKKPAPAKEELKKFAQEIRQLFEQAQKKPEEADKILTRWNQEYPVPQLWSKMLNLIYTGNENEALNLFEEAWPETFPGKQKALKRFNALVDGSPFNPRKNWQGKPGK